MPNFISDGLTLHYQRVGAGTPVLLIHGFGSSGSINWVATGWADTLAAEGYEALILDNRGHGDSDKPYDEERYFPQVMAEDARALLDHSGIERCFVIGYSMGARIAAFLALLHPERVAAAVLGGMGMNLITGLSDSEEIIAALRATSLDDVDHPTGQMFRRFADQSKADRLALASCMVHSREPMLEEFVRRISPPVLVAVGERDEMAGSPQALAALLPHGEAFTIARRDHMLATGDRTFKAAALHFLRRHAHLIGGA
jgi:pimeloyl-ACP methyl ester carboxylesterase